MHDGHCGIKPWDLISCGIIVVMPDLQSIFKKMIVDNYELTDI